MRSHEVTEPTQVIITAGMGCRRTSLGMLSIIAEQCEERGLPMQFVDGSFTNQQNDREVSPPSRQVEEIEAHLEAVPEETPTLIVAHCGGGTAAMDVVEKRAASSKSNLRALLIAPPFDNPAQAFMLSEVQRSIVFDGEASFLDIYDTPSDDPYNFSRRVMSRLAIGSAFYDEMRAIAKTDFVGRARRLATKDILGIVVPQDDWNQAAVHTTKSWQGPILRIDGARHSLRMPSDTLEDQRKACQDALNFGLQL